MSTPFVAINMNIKYAYKYKMERVDIEVNPILFDKKAAELISALLDHPAISIKSGLNSSFIDLLNGHLVEDESSKYIESALTNDDDDSADVRPVKRKPAEQLHASGRRQYNSRIFEIISNRPETTFSYTYEQFNDIIKNIRSHAKNAPLEALVKVYNYYNSNFMIEKIEAQDLPCINSTFKEITAMINGPRLTSFTFLSPPVKKLIEHTLYMHFTAVAQLKKCICGNLCGLLIMTKIIPHTLVNLLASDHDWDFRIFPSEIKTACNKLVEKNLRHVILLHLKGVNALPESIKHNRGFEAKYFDSYSMCPKTAVTYAKLHNLPFDYEHYKLLRNTIIEAININELLKLHPELYYI
jgi:hypothetical protein